MSAQPNQDARFGAWLQSLGSGSGTDTLLHFVPSERNSVELTHAHPSGLAQLLAGRRTRLSTLLRDPVQYSQARRTARAIGARIEDVAAQRGIEVGYLASGLVTWRTLRQGGNDFYSAPVMLGHVSLERRDGVDDEELQIAERSTPNPALLRHLRHAFGISIDATTLSDAAYVTARFDPSAPLQVLREALRDIPGLVVADRLVVSTFADVADPADPGVVSPQHPVVAALMDAVGDDTVHTSRHSRLAARNAAKTAKAEAAEAAEAAAGEEHDDAAAEAAVGGTPAGEASAEAPGADGVATEDAAAAEPAEAAGEEKAEADAPSSGTEETPRILAPGEPDPAAAAAEVAQGAAERAALAAQSPTLRDDVTTPGSDERDPADELLVLDADEEAYAALDLVSHGRSLTLSAPPGTGGTTFAVNAAVRLAAQGKRVLVVAEREQSVTDFIAQLGSRGLDTLALPLRRDVDAEELRRRLVEAVLRNEQASEPHPRTNESLLRDRRVSLLEHVRSLRSVRPRWNASPLQAMQELARVTSRVPAPSTTVRLKRSVLDAMPERGPVATQLMRAAELGAFDDATRTSPWFGARLSHRGQAESALELVRSLAKDVPPLRAKLEATAKATRIKPVRTFEQWGKTLRLLVDVRHSLDHFEPDIFDKAVDDLIAATASPAWRKDRGIEMSSMTRSRLRRVAKEYVRPGVHIEDLHTALTQVQTQRKAWEVLATDRRYPTVPSGLEAVLATFREVSARLEKLEAVLPAPVEEGRTLRGLPAAELESTLERLVAAEADLEVLPERTLLLQTLREQGLGELLEDFERRGVLRELIPSELDQAWWQSVLEAMVSGDDYLALQDGRVLGRAQREFAQADAKHIASGAEAVKHRLAERWRGALADHRVAARDLRALLKIGDPTVAQFAAISPDLTGALVPIWIGAPLFLPSALPRWSRFDATILLDAESLSLVSALGAVGRSDQVIAIGDPGSGAPRPLNVTVDPGEASQARRVPLSAYEALAKVTPRRSLTRVHRPLDERLVQALSSHYDGELNAHPDPRTGERRAAVLHVPEGVSTAGQAAAESTQAEVDAVVELVFAQLAEHPERSLAVVAGNAHHARAVARGIGAALRAHPEAEPAFKRGYEPFVVTSAERLQGLRRDAVIFTLGYGRTAHGRPVHDFGQLGTPQGARAVAAALLSGREWVRIVSALSPSELDSGRLRHGSALLVAAMRALQQGGQDPAAAELSDPLMRDLAERLKVWGLQVSEAPYEGIDLAVFGPEGGDRPPVAVISDAGDDYASATVRQRSRILPLELVRRGWNPIQVWTIDVFSDPAAVARHIAAALGLQTPRGRHDASAQAGKAAGAAGSQSSDAPAETAERGRRAGV
ncbi:DNA helicase [Galactobacter valiniphilus]|uniref:DNA helicase n=1 Tax=Galactobacter valiniphilus TaxID=2676122 RepID=UPI0037350062